MLQTAIKLGREAVAQREAIQAQTWASFAPYEEAAFSIAERLAAGPCALNSDDEELMHRIFILGAAQLSLNHARACLLELEMGDASEGETP